MDAFKGDPHPEGEGELYTEPNMPQLPRSLSGADPQMASKINKELAANVREPESSGKPHTIANIANFSIHLDASASQSTIMFEEAMKILVDEIMKEDLESRQTINWLPGIQRLVPIRTMGDGNCLLHALALAIWGVEDSSLLLRRLLYIALVQDDDKGRIKKRWQSERRYLDANIPGGGLNLDTMEWENEWGLVVKAAEDMRQTNPLAMRSAYECLEEIHIFVMANILKRPIIIVSESVVRDFVGGTLAPNNFGGIYLPLLWRQDECYKSPIILGYSSNHFAPLISTKSPSEIHTSTKGVLPLIRSNFEALHVHFLLPHEESSVHKLFQGYLNFDEVRLEGQTPPRDTVPAARLEHQKPPPNLDLVKSYFDLAQRLFRNWMEQRKRRKIEAAKEFKRPSGNENTEILKAPMFTAPSTTPTGVSMEPQESPLLNLSLDPETELEVIPASPTPSSPFKLSQSTQHKMCTKCGKYCGASEFGGLCSLCFSNGPVASSGNVEMRSIEDPPLASPVTSQANPLDTEEMLWEQLPPHNRAHPPPIGELSMIPEKCNTPGCSHFSSTKTYPYCHEHKVTITSITPHNPSEAGPVFRRSTTTSTASYEERTKCKGNNCRNQPKYQGYCSICFVQNANEEAEPYQKCRIPACPGRAVEELDRYCSGCFQRTPIEKSEPAFQRTPMEKSGPTFQRTPMENSGPTFQRTPMEISGPSFQRTPMEKSAPFRDPPSMTTSYERSMNATVTCVTPGCQNNGVMTNNGLCDDCLKTIMRSRAGQHKTQVPTDQIRVSSKQGVERPTPCKTQGCDMYGTADRQGYCSKCYQTEVLQPGYVQYGSGNTLVVLPQPVVVEKPAYVQSINPEARECKSHHCDLIGDPNLDGYCSRCFVNAPSVRPTIPHHHHSSQRSLPQNPITASRLTRSEPLPSSMTVTQRREEGYTEAMQQLEQAHLGSAKQCRYRTCRNYGNPAKMGYCNSCAKELAKANLLTGYDECDGPTVKTDLL